MATRALSDLLDDLERSSTGDSIAVGDVVESLGDRSFASLMLIFSLISTSPASAIPGLTTLVGATVFLMTAQMIAGRKSLWLPGVITRRRMSTLMLRTGIDWLRRPLRFVERFLKARLTFLLHRPWIFVPLVCILGLTLVMPVMELIPASGSIASAAIALFAAGLLTRDGGLVLLSLGALLGVPLAIWSIGSDI